MTKMSCLQRPLAIKLLKQNKAMKNGPGIKRRKKRNIDIKNCMRFLV